MTTHQLSKNFSVREIAAIISKLTRKQKDRLCDLVWDDLHEIKPEYMIPEKPLRDIMNPSISLEEFKRLHCPPK